MKARPGYCYICFILNTLNFVFKWYIIRFVVIYITIIYDQCNHSYKKRKGSLETRAELAVLCTYVENQATLKPILLYSASKCKKTKEYNSEDYLRTCIFTFFCVINVSLFPYFCQDVNKTGSSCATTGWSLSKKYKLALHETQSGGPNFYNILLRVTFTTTWGQTAEYYETC